MSPSTRGSVSPEAEIGYVSLTGISTAASAQSVHVARGRLEQQVQQVHCGQQMHLWIWTYTWVRQSQHSGCQLRSRLVTAASKISFTVLAGPQAADVMLRLADSVCKLTLSRGVSLQWLDLHHRLLLTACWQIPQWPVCRWADQLADANSLICEQSAGSHLHWQMQAGRTGGRCH